MTQGSKAGIEGVTEIKVRRVKMVRMVEMIRATEVALRKYGPRIKG